MPTPTATHQVPTQPSPLPPLAVPPAPVVPPAHYCLNAGHLPPPTCTDGQRHSWITIESPRGCNSGWHEERCARCNITQSYDTSD